jgi:hypothetical protein
MKKVINPQAIEIQKRFFEALEIAIESGQINGLKGFCENHALNRVKYCNIKAELNKPHSERKESNYKIIDLDALAYICNDFKVSPEWLLSGRGKMFK